MIDSLIANKGNFDLHRLQEVYSVLKSFETDHHFTDAIIEFKYEIETYDSNGMKKPVYG